MNRRFEQRSRRQAWMAHRKPVFYCDSGHAHRSLEAKERCENPSRGRKVKIPKGEF